MKNTIFSLLLLFCIPFTQSNAQNYGLGNTDPSVFTNFKIPDTDLRSIWFNTNLYLNTYKSDRTYLESGNTVDVSNYNSNFRYSLNPHYFLFRESDDHLLSLNTDITGGYQHTYSEYHQPDQNVNKNKNNGYTTDINLNLNYNKYINSGNLFYSAGSIVSVSMSDSKSVETLDSTVNSYSGSKYQNYTFVVGFGFGKLRNITPVVTAIRFQERLKQINLIDKDLNQNTIEDLAGQFYKQSYYSNIHNRPEKYFWQDVDKTLSNDGVSLKDLNMYSDAWLRESLQEVRFLRSEGFQVGINFRLNYMNDYYNYGNRYNLVEKLFTMGEAYINFSHQLNLNSQLGFDLSLIGGPNVIKHPSIKQQYDLIAGLTYNYELTDRLVMLASNSFNLAFDNYNIQQKSLSNSTNLSLKYFVEDNLSLNATYIWDYSNLKLPYDYISRSSGNDHTLNIGFTFYFDRGFLVNETASQTSSVHQTSITPTPTYTY